MKRSFIQKTYSSSSIFSSSSFSRSSNKVFNTRIVNPSYFYSTRTNQQQQQSKNFNNPLLYKTVAAAGISLIFVVSSVRTFHASSSTNRKENVIHFPIRYDYEFNSLALSKTPLLANFTLRGDPKSDALTGAMIKIVSYETDYSISAVDIEVDEPTVRELLERYAVSFILNFFKLFFFFFFLLIVNSFPMALKSIVLYKSLYLCCYTIVIVYLQVPLNTPSHY